MQRTLRIVRLLSWLVIAAFSPVTAILAADFSAIWDGGNGNWDNPIHWNTNPEYPDNTGGVTYDATITRGTVTLDHDITIQRLFLSANDFSFRATLAGASELTLNEGLTWTNGDIGHSVSAPNINLATGSTSTISTMNGGAVLYGNINNFGTVTQTGDFDSLGIINNPAGATWNLQGGGMNNPRPFYNPGPGGTFNNAGNLVVSPIQIFSGGTAGVSMLTALNNTGSVTIEAPAQGVETTFTVWGNAAGDGSFNVGADCRFDLIGYTFNADSTITGPGSTQFFGITIAGDTNVTTNLANISSLVIQKGATLTLSGTFDQPAPGPFGTGATTRLNGGTINSTHPLNFGQNTNLTGSGTINGDVISGANISPGASAGRLTINGSVSLLNNSKLVMEIGGLTQGTQYDYLAISGMVTLDGTLELHMLNSFQLQLEPGQTFTLLTSKDLSGAFDNVANGARLTTADGLASFQVNYGAGSPYGANNLVLSDPQGVPEPASLVLFAGGIAMIGFFRFRRRVTDPLRYSSRKR